MAKKAKQAARRSSSARRPSAARKAVKKKPAKKARKTAGKTKAKRKAKTKPKSKAKPKAKPRAKPKAKAKAKPKAKKVVKAKNAPKARKAPARAKAPSKTAAKKATVARKPVAKAKPVPEAKPKRKLTKSPYSRKELSPLQQALLTLRRRVAGDMDMMGQEALRADDPDVDAENVADHGSDAFERTMTLELMENEARTIRLINEALEQMAKGRYGLCAGCGDPIPLPRLEALPFARMCVPCQEAEERGY